MQNYTEPIEEAKKKNTKKTPPNKTKKKENENGKQKKVSNTRVRQIVSNDGK